MVENISNKTTDRIPMSIIGDFKIVDLRVTHVNFFMDHEDAP
jgi:hypothetical protein